MRVNPFLLPLIVIVALLGTIGVAQAAGIWTTSGRTAVDYANMTPDDLKGWMTLQQAMDGLKLAKAELYAAGNIPLDMPPETAMKDLEGMVDGFELSLLRDALNARLGAGTPPAEQAPTSPATPEATVVSPTAAPQAQATVHALPTPLPEGQVLAASDIKGRMTLGEVSDQCAVPLAELLAKLKLAPDTNPNTALKDLVSAGKLGEVSDVQSVVAEMQK